MCNQSECEFAAGVTFWTRCTSLRLYIKHSCISTYHQLALAILTALAFATVSISRNATVLVDTVSPRVANHAHFTLFKYCALIHASIVHVTSLFFSLLFSFWNKWLYLQLDIVTNYVLLLMIISSLRSNCIILVCNRFWLVDVRNSWDKQIGATFYQFQFDRLKWHLEIFDVI